MASDGLVPLLRRVCLRCGRYFGICRPCFRGQRYCSAACRYQQRRERQREANRRHQQSPAGRDDHRDRQRDYRNRMKGQGVTDQSCGPEAGPRSLPDGREQIHDLAQTQAVWLASPGPSTSAPACIGCRRPGVLVEQYPTGDDYTHWTQRID